MTTTTFSNITNTAKMDEKTIQERVDWLNAQIPEDEPKLTYYECGEVDYLLTGPEPDDNELETGEWDERVLAINEYKHSF